MGPEFFQTRMGQAFYEGTMPRLAKAVDRYASALERQNELKEFEMGIKPIPARDPELVKSIIDRMNERSPETRNSEFIVKDPDEVQKVWIDRNAFEEIHGIKVEGTRGSMGKELRLTRGA
jgi:hypothetical protein